jgi:hypothetical protein
MLASQEEFSSLELVVSVSMHFRFSNFPRFENIIYFYATIWKWIFVKINVGGVFWEIQNGSVFFLFHSVRYAVAKRPFMNPVTTNPPKQWGGCALLDIHDIV